MWNTFLSMDTSGIHLLTQKCLQKTSWEWSGVRGHQKRIYRTMQNSVAFPNIAQLVKNPPGMLETPVRFLGREDPLEKG